MPNFHYSPNNCCNIVHPVRQCYFLRADRNSWELPLGYVLPTMAPFPQLRPSSDFNRETWAAACVGSGRMCDICAEMHVFPNIEVKRRGRALPGSVVMETIGECGWHLWLVSGKEKGIYYLIFFLLLPISIRTQSEIRKELLFLPGSVSKLSSAAFRARVTAVFPFQCSNYYCRMPMWIRGRLLLS